MRYFSLPQQWTLFVLALLLLGSLYFKFYYQSHPTPSGESRKKIVIEVSGEIRRPGVYLFQNPPNLREAIERAGGMKETGVLDATASSDILETGTLLNVVKISSQITPPSSSPGGKNGGIQQKEIRIRISRMAAEKLLVFYIPLDLNQVSLDDLCLIPGIGNSLAQEIIAYRKSRRGFRSVEELRNVRGIGDKKYQNLKGYFTIQ